MPIGLQVVPLSIFLLQFLASSLVHSEGLCWSLLLGHSFVGARPSSWRIWCRGRRRRFGGLGQWTVGHYRTELCSTLRIDILCSFIQNFGRSWRIWWLGARPLSTLWSSPQRLAGVLFGLCRARMGQWCPFPIWRTATVMSCSVVLLIASDGEGQTLGTSWRIPCNLCEWSTSSILLGWLWLP